MLRGVAHLAHARGRVAFACSRRIVSPAENHKRLRSIASATSPLLAARNNSRRFKHRKKKGSEERPKSNKAKIAQLRADLVELEAKAKAKKDGYSPTIEKAPFPPMIPLNEAQERYKANWTSLMSKVNDISDETSKKLVLFDLGLIKSGNLAFRELRKAAQLAAYKTGARDAQHLVLTLDDKYWKKHWSIDRYGPNLERVFSLQTVSAETREKILKEVGALMSSEFRPAGERMEEIVFSEIPESEKEAYLDEKAEVILNQKKGIFSEGVGVSMLPTLPTRSILISRVIAESDWPGLQIDDLVSFVFRKPEGNATHASKRITALEGDVVDFKGGKVVVPSGHVWVEGDNKAESLDSRTVGALPFENRTLERGILCPTISVHLISGGVERSKEIFCG